MSWLASGVHMEYIVPGADNALRTLLVKAAQDSGNGKGVGIWRLRFL